MISPYQAIKKEIELSARRCGRNPDEITLVAVTKQVTWQTASKLYDQRQRDFAENRVPEALAKQAEAPQDCRWHFIGPLQTNKLRKFAGKFAFIHSVHDEDLAEKLARVGRDMGISIPILLQANTSGETTKQGLNAESWKACFEKVMSLEGLSVKGLMTMAPLTNDEDAIRKCFRGLRILRDELRIISGNQADLLHLSMGMSHDFKIAIEEGATLLRIGTALFEAVKK